MSANFHLTRLRVSQLRKFDSLEIAQLGEGLNIIAGPNGAGKSSLARAIHAAFLDRYGSNSAADLQPFGNSGAAPSVELDFVLHGKPHQLSKTFLKKKRCDLVIGSSSRSEQDAEDYLAEQLGFGFSKSGSSPKHWGVPGLLWVEQGSAHKQLQEQVNYASVQLGAALHAQQAGAASSVAAGLVATAGDSLIAEFEDALQSYLSRATRKPSGEYAALLNRLAEKQKQLQEQQQRVADYRNQVDELQQLLADEKSEAAEQPAKQWQVQLEQANNQLNDLKALQQRHEQSQQQAEQLKIGIDALQRELSQQSAQQRKLQERRLALEQAELAHKAVMELLAQAKVGSEAAQKQAEAAQTAWQQAQQAREREDLGKRLQSAQRQLQQLNTAKENAQLQLQKMQQLAIDLSGLQLEKADIQNLKALEDAVLKSEIQRDAMATHLQFELPDGKELPWQAGSQQGRWVQSGEQWLDSETRIVLPGGGQLRITPGGKDVGGVAQRHTDAKAALAQALQRLNVSSRAEAENLWEQRQSLQAQNATAQQLLKAQAPLGLDALLLEVSQQAELCTSLTTQIQALAGGASEQAIDWNTAQAAQQATAQALQLARSQEQSAAQQMAVKTQQMQSAQVEYAAAQSINDPAAQERVQEAQKQLTSREAELAQLQSQLQSDEGALAATPAQFAVQDIERLQRSLQAHAQQLQQRTLRMAQLHSALETAGAQGLEEANAALAGEIAHDQRMADAMHARAQALATVVDRLKEKRSAALRRLQAPLEKRMQHYLQLLLPGGTIELDEQLLPRIIAVRGGEDSGNTASHGAAARVVGEVQTLSYGTQEQLAIISRLAYADLLRDAGQPTLLMFDDVLTFSDPQRLSQMKRVIYDAATRHQILLLTCHPDQWKDMGVALRTLSADQA